MAVYDITQGIPSSYISGDILNCPATGQAITMTLKKGTYLIEAWGSVAATYTRGTPGRGGYSKGTLTLTGDRTIYFCAGTNTGYNGGGSTNAYGGKGGGGSDLRLGSNSLYARVIVAGGGGGPGYSTTAGGYAGGASGGQGGNGSSTGGYGGTQTSGGTNNNPGSFGTGGTTRAGGGGGGGWYGGSSGISAGTDSGGGGGSGYVYTSATASNYPSGCLLTSADYLTNTQMIAGNSTITEPDGTTSTGHATTGYIRITVISTTYMGKYKQNGVWVNAEIYSKANGSWISTADMMNNYQLHIQVPTQQNIIYQKESGESQSPIWNAYTNTYIDVSGTTSAVVEGTYYATMALKSNLNRWMDGTTGIKQVPWTILAPQNLEYN